MLVAVPAVVAVQFPAAELELEPELEAELEPDFVAAAVVVAFVSLNRKPIEP